MRRWLVIGLAMAVAQFIAFIWAWIGPTMPWGSAGFAWGLGFFAVIPALASIVLFPIAVALCLSKRARPWAVPLAVTTSLFFVNWHVATMVGHALRRRAFSALAVRSGPLVRAVEQYERAHGQPPASLTDLVPRFLPAVPSPRMVGSPQYQYFVGAEAESYRGNPWVLRVPAIGPGIRFDALVYFPNREYEAYSRRAERMGEWAFDYD